MTDDKTDRGAPEPGQGSAEELYEVAFFAKKHGIDRGQSAPDY